MMKQRNEEHIVYVYLTETKIATAGCHRQVKTMAKLLVTLIFGQIEF